VYLDGKRLISGLREDVFAYFAVLADCYPDPITFPKMQKRAPELKGVNQSRFKVDIPKELAALVSRIPNSGHVLCLPD
jgi:hypothetical protein